MLSRDDSRARRHDHLVRRQRRGLGAASSGRADILIGDDDVRAARASCSATSRPMPLPPPTTSDNPAAELALGRHPLQLGFLQRPVLDAERLGARQRDVIVKARELGCLFRAPRLRQRVRRRGGSSSAVAPAITWIALTKNSVVIRASRLSLREPEDADPGNDDHRWIRVPKRRRVRVANDL